MAPFQRKVVYLLHHRARSRPRAVMACENGFRLKTTQVFASVKIASDRRSKIGLVAARHSPRSLLAQQNPQLRTRLAQRLVAAGRSAQVSSRVAARPTGILIQIIRLEFLEFVGAHPVTPMVD